MSLEKKHKIHHAWIILAGCCMMQGASLGLINNCAGIFYAPVCGELGFKMGEFSAYRMLFILGSAFAMPFVAKVFQKRDIRAVISIAAVICCGACVAMGTFEKLWQWYAAGIIQGMSSAFLTMVPAPIILSNWFHKKAGTAVGISAAFSGLMGMIGSSSLGVSIPLLGWRMSYILVGAVSMALILPVSLFILRYRPEEMGLQAYGEETAESKSRLKQEGEYETGNSWKTAKEKEEIPGLSGFMGQPAFYVATAAYTLSMAAAVLNSFLTSCGVAAGLSLTTAAMMTSISLFGNMVSKFVLGRASDSYGVVRIFLASLLVSGTGHLLLLNGSQGSVIAGALFYGITLPLSTVMMPLFCKLFWKGDVYAAAYSYISMAGTFISAPCNMLFGKFYDMTGSYSLTISVSAAGILFMAFLVLAGGRLVKRIPSQAQ